MKQKIRFDGLDVAAMTAQIRSSLLGHKLANVYDGAAVCTSTAGADGNTSKSTFLFKLANPSSVSTNASTKDGDESHSTRKTSSENIDAKTDFKTPTTATTDVSTGSVRTGSTPSTNRINMLLMESGIRFHTTNYYTVSDNSTQPSPFAMKLRKHLRNLRLENVTQLGNLDRVVDFRFGLGDQSHHLILELYGMGNIILTDSRYVILALLRVHEYTVGRGIEEKKNETAQGIHNNKHVGDYVEGDVKVRVGNVYPVTYATTISRPSEEVTTAMMDASKDGHVGRGRSLLDMTDGEQAYQWTKGELHTLLETQALQSKISKPSSRKKKDKDGSINLKTLLLKPNSGVFHFGPSLIEHCILFAGLDPGTQLTLDTLEQVMLPNQWGKLLECLRVEGNRVISEFTRSETKGYVLYRKRPTIAQNDSAKTSDWIKNMPHSDKIFEEFQPHLLQQHNDRPSLLYDSFSHAVDEFYSLLEGQKRAMRAEAAEQNALLKLEKIQKDQAKRMEGLEIEMNKVKEDARLVEMHADDVDKAIGVINSALDSGMDWISLEELVEVEKNNMNPIALLIKKLNLDKDEVVLSLPDTMSWDQGSGEAPLIADVSISLKESAFGNARIMYDHYRSSKEKAERTVEASEKALKAAEANAQKQIEQAQKKKQLTYSILTQPQRKPHWFEKFLWFITSDNYLCIGGRDAQQNEQLVKKYLRPGDAYLHADIHGAPTCILRAKRRRTENGGTKVLPLSEQALREAGSFAICRSSAWSSRVVTSAWWVESHQVSKTAPTGEYLTVGSFMIRGKKNFLPPTQLEMGIAVLFRLGDEASIVRHKNERRDFSIMALDQEADQDEMKEMKLMKPKTRDIKSDGVGLDSNNEKSNGKEKGQMSSHKIETSAKSDANKDSEESNVPKSSNGNTDITNNPPKMVPELDDSNPSSENTQYENNEDSVKPKKKGGLSAKDRKLIKKYGSLEAAEEALSTIRAQEEQVRKMKESLDSSKAQTSAETLDTSQSRNIRGKKSKQKKISKKYSDQDEEDRELALLVLQGSTKEKKKKGGRNVQAESTSQIKAAAETVALLVRDASEVIDKVPTNVREYLAKAVTVNDQIRWDKLEAEVLEQLLSLDNNEVQEAVAKRLLQLSETSRIDNFSSSLSGIIRTAQKYGHQGLIDTTMNNTNDGNVSKQRGRKTKEEKEAEKQSWREILSEDGAILDGNDNENDDGVDDTAEISKLTSKPFPEDVILHAIPVCAPYSTLSQYKYRVKLVPGNLKRGKAAKQCLEIFLHNHNNNSNSDKSKEVEDNNAFNSRCIDLIKAINDNEWVQAICGDVKISSAGASKVMKKSKKVTKSKK
mmetsp:Transcript_4509/g.8679  ORF Transcript_4509/g.8679 Transcript_4509/m.8679 type:complete len:1337 (+) Transcript_4509:102-4112(+)